MKVEKGSVGFFDGDDDDESGERGWGLVVDEGNEEAFFKKKKNC